MRESHPRQNKSDDPPGATRQLSHTHEPIECVLVVGDPIEEATILRAHELGQGVSKDVQERHPLHERFFERGGRENVLPVEMMIVIQLL